MTTEARRRHWWPGRMALAIAGLAAMAGTGIDQRSAWPTGSVEALRPYFPESPPLQAERYDTLAEMVRSADAVVEGEIVRFEATRPGSGWTNPVAYLRITSVHAGEVVSVVDGYALLDFGAGEAFERAITGVQGLWALRLMDEQPEGRFAHLLARDAGIYRLVNLAGLIVDDHGTAVNVGAENLPGYRDPILDTTDGIPFAEMREAAIAAARD